MKKILYTLLLVLFTIMQVVAQKSPIQNKLDKIPADQFVVEKPFTIKLTPSNRLSIIKQYVNKFVLLEVNNVILSKIANNKPKALEVDIPLTGSMVTLQLTESNVVNEQTIFTTQNGIQKTRSAYTPGAYYYGVIKNQPNTVVAISFFNNNIIGVISNEKGNYVLGKTNTTDISSNEYITYNDRDLLIKNTFACNETGEQPSFPTIPLAPSAPAPAGNCVWVHIEADFRLFQNNGSNEDNVRNLVTGLFNVTTTLYFNERINTLVQEVTVFAARDPYDTATNTANTLHVFSNAMRGGFNGNLAHLFSGRPIGGGRANIAVLCSPDNSFRTAVSGDLGNNAAFPTYSWNAYVVTHEMGHNLGSPHTHACFWNGTNTAIDGCGPAYGSGSTPPITYEGTCSGAPIPTGGGTIMSSCHLGGAGINFMNGFGPQPGDTIRNRVNGATCLMACSAACPNLITISTPINATVKHEAFDGIVASSTVTTSAGQSVLFDAGRQVQLSPGFRANVSAGGFFRAYIDGCRGAFITEADKTATPMPENKKQDVVTETSTDALQVYPNPFTNKLTISYNNIGNDKVSIEIFSIAGVRVAVLQQPKTTTKGNHSINWDAAHIPSGVYIIVLTTDTGKKIQKVVKL